MDLANFSKIKFGEFNTFILQRELKFHGERDELIAGFLILLRIKHL